MADVSEIVRQRQTGIRRELDRRGIALKVVALDSNIPYPTLLTYFPMEGAAKPVMLPMSAVYSLAAGNAIPSDLLSLLVPDGFAIVRVPEALNHDEIAEAMVEYLAEKQKAHHPESECGPAIGPNESGKLTGLALIVGRLAA